MIRRHWFLFEYVDRRPSNEPLAHCRSEICLVDDAAARTVDETHPLFHAPHFLHGNHAARLLRERHMDSDEVGFFYNIVEQTDRHAERLCTLFVDIGIVGDDVHVKGEGALCNAAADASHADDAERLAAQLDTDIRLAVPLPPLHGLIRRRDIARHREHHRHRVLRRRNRIAARRVDDDNAAFGRRLHIDVVNADTRPADDLQIFRARDHVRRHL